MFFFLFPSLSVIVVVVSGGGGCRRADDAVVGVFVAIISVV